MTATPSLQQREFQSYLDELLLLSTEVEINAFWKRMDESMVNMNIAEKTSFFQQLEQSMDNGFQLNERLLAEAKRFSN